MSIRLRFAIGFTCVAFAAYAAHSPSVLADPEGAAEGGWRMYDPGGSLKEFQFQAYPETCSGTSESIEAIGREAARRRGPLPSSPRLRLMPEPVPPGTPAGWRGFALPMASVFSSERFAE